MKIIAILLCCVLCALVACQPAQQETQTNEPPPENIPQTPEPEPEQTAPVAEEIVVAQAESEVQGPTVQVVYQQSSQSDVDQDGNVDYQFQINSIDGETLELNVVHNNNVFIREVEQGDIVKLSDGDSAYVFDVQIVNIPSPDASLKLFIGNFSQDDVQIFTSGESIEVDGLKANVRLDDFSRDSAELRYSAAATEYDLEQGETTLAGPYVILPIVIESKTDTVIATVSLNNQEVFNITDEAKLVHVDKGLYIVSLKDVYIDTSLAQNIGFVYSIQQDDRSDEVEIALGQSEETLGLTITPESFGSRPDIRSEWVMTKLS